MAALDAIRDALPESARDIKLNVQSVLQDGSLSPAQRWGVAIASAATARNRPLLDAIVADALGVVDATVVDDALAAATLMAMNNVYYRFRHMVGKPVYEQKPARLRMNRLAKPPSFMPPPSRSRASA
jgi:lipoyl-dependent peroxiredoxin subunit D